jgi:hypothetical protein
LSFYDFTASSAAFLQRMTFFYAFVCMARDGCRGGKLRFHEGLMVLVGAIQKFSEVFRNF